MHNLALFVFALLTVWVSCNRNEGRTKSKFHPVEESPAAESHQTGHRAETPQGQTMGLRLQIPTRSLSGTGIPELHIIIYIGVFVECPLLIAYVRWSTTIHLASYYLRICVWVWTSSHKRRSLNVYGVFIWAILQTIIQRLQFYKFKWSFCIFSDADDFYSISEQARRQSTRDFWGRLRA